MAVIVVTSKASILSKLDLPPLVRLAPALVEDIGLFSRFFRLDCGRVCVEAVLTSLEYSRPPSDSMVRKCKEIRLEHLPLKHEKNMGKV